MFCLHCACSVSKAIHNALVLLLCNIRVCVVCMPLLEDYNSCCAMMLCVTWYAMLSIYVLWLGMGKFTNSYDESKIGLWKDNEYAFIQPEKEEVS